MTLVTSFADPVDNGINWAHKRGCDDEEVLNLGSRYVDWEVLITYLERTTW